MSESREFFAKDHRVVYAGEPDERITLLHGTECAIVVHPDRPPKIVRADGSIEVLSISLKFEEKP